MKFLQQLIKESAAVDKELFVDQIATMASMFGMSRKRHSSFRAVQALFDRYFDRPVDATDPEDLQNALYALSPDELSAIMYKLKGILDRQDRAVDRRRRRRMH